MRAVTHDVGRHVARSVRGRRGPAALLGPGDMRATLRRVGAMSATLTLLPAFLYSGVQ